TDSRNSEESDRGPPHVHVERSYGGPLRGGAPSDDDQVPGGDVEPVGARLGADDDVLDARAVGPGQVEAGLDGEGEAGLQRFSVAGDDVRVLVAFDADAVAGAVDEVVAVAGLGDDVAGGGVDRLARDAGADGFAGGVLGTPQHLVVGGEVGRGLADAVHAGGVGAVAAGHLAADVDHDRLAGLDDPVGDVVVRAGAVGPGGDDGEVDGGVAGGEDGLGDVARHLAL